MILRGTKMLTDCMRPAGSAATPERPKRNLPNMENPPLNIKRGGLKFFKSSPDGRHSSAEKNAEGQSLVQRTVLGTKDCPYQRRGTFFTVRTVSRAMRSSSFVGMTYAFSFDEVVVISPSLPEAMPAFLSASMERPRNSS